MPSLPKYEKRKSISKKYSYLSLVISAPLCQNVEIWAAIFLLYLYQSIQNIYVSRAISSPLWFPCQIMKIGKSIYLTYSYLKWVISSPLCLPCQNVEIWAAIFLQHEYFFSTNTSTTQMLRILPNMTETKQNLTVQNWGKMRRHHFPEQEGKIYGRGLI